MLIGKLALLASTAALAISTASTAIAQDQTLLLRDPDMSDRHIAFVYSGDIWLANQDGTAPRRLTSSETSESNPVFSPDGSMLAYNASFEGNTDVYIVPVVGGQPTRLTYHPGRDTVRGWSPDGREVAFTSGRETNNGRSAQLYHAKVEGGLPVRQMDARVFEVSYDANAQNIAFNTFASGYNGLHGGSAGWRQYRGGSTPSIRVMNVRSGNVTEIAGDRVNDIEPMWIGDQVYFLSDRNDVNLNIFRANPATGEIAQVSSEPVWDIRAASAHNDQIIYESGGRLKVMNTASGDTREIAVSIEPDLPQMRPQWKDASRTLQNVDISPNGKRVVVTARGDVFTVPIEDGSTRNLSNTDGAREYTAMWSPDGQQIAYIDASAEAQVLVITDQFGNGEAKRFPLAEDFNFLIEWGGKGERIVYHDHRNRLFAIDVETGRKTLVSTGVRRDGFSADTSPDGRWLAHTEEQANFNRALKLYDFQTGNSYIVGDTFADADAPAFSPDGAYLYFAASTNSGPLQVGLDLSSQEKPYRAGLYAVVLAADGASPLKPKSGDEEAKSEEEDKDEDKEKDEEETDKATRIDIEGLNDRIVGLPVSERNYGSLDVAKDGTLYFVRYTQAGVQREADGDETAEKNALMRFDLEEREAEEVMDGVNGAAISASGEHIWISDEDGNVSAGEIKDNLDLKRVSMSGVRMMVNPRNEWRQIFDEAWRMEKHYFYDPNMHGLDWQAVYDRYSPLVDHVGSREDLNTLMVEMIGEMQVGHNRTGGGDIYREDRVAGGLLGADIALDGDVHQISKIYTGETWNPFIEAPLAVPGINVSEGDYILAVNGADLGPQDNIHFALQGTVGEQVTLRVSSRKDGRDARDIVVEPTGNEYQLRLWNWVEDARKQVDEATDGRVGYVYLPDTAGGGYFFFNRMFYAQVDKEAMILDDRSNSGGQAANYVTDVLSRTYLAGWKEREGEVFRTPGAAVYGPKVMLIDQDAGSGGDFLPYAFRTEGLGPLIGTRTWGGLIGISANPPLIDGGGLSVPNFRFYDADHQWTIENEGVAPDIEVKLDTAATNAGRDNQLERAIAEIQSLLASQPSTVPDDAPPYPTPLAD